MERWLTHPIHVDYEVSDLGRVRRKTAKAGTRADRLKTPYVRADGYAVVNLPQTRRNRKSPPR